MQEFVVEDADTKTLCVFRSSVHSLILVLFTLNRSANRALENLSFFRAVIGVGCRSRSSVYGGYCTKYKRRNTDMNCRDGRNRMRGNLCIEHKSLFRNNKTAVPPNGDDSATTA